MGTIYLATSLCMTTITYRLPLIKSAQTRNVASGLLIMAATFLVYKAFELYKWKAGYYLHVYLP
jgi:hypothetical protein